jgi:hypothetical protein
VPLGWLVAVGAGMVVTDAVWAIALTPAVASRAARTRLFKRVKAWRVNVMETSFREEGWQVKAVG